MDASDPHRRRRPRGAKPGARGVRVLSACCSRAVRVLLVCRRRGVFWNLGNFVWPRLSQASATTAVAEWIVEPDGTVTSCLLPAEIDDLGVPAPTGEPRRCE